MVEHASFALAPRKHATASTAGVVWVPCANCGADVAAPGEGEVEVRTRPNPRDTYFLQILCFDPMACAMRRAARA